MTNTYFKDKTVSLTSDNWYEFETSMKGTLMSQRCYKVAMGRILKPEGSDSAAILARASWEELDEKAQGLIVTHVTISRQEVLNAGSAWEAWQLLEKLYKRSSIALLTRYVSEFYRMEKPASMPMAEWIDSVKVAVNRLEGLGRTVPVMDKVMVLLDSVSVKGQDSYNAVVTPLQAQWDSCDTELEATKDVSFDFVCNALLNEEIRLKGSSGKRLDHLKTNPGALKAGSSSSDGARRRKCFLCESEEHLQRECPVFKSLLSLVEKDTKEKDKEKASKARSRRIEVSDSDEEDFERIAGL